MNTKVDNVLLSKDFSFKTNDKFGINQNRDARKNNNFQDKIESFAKDNKNEFKSESSVKKQNKDDKNKSREKKETNQIEQFKNPEQDIQQNEKQNKIMQQDEKTNENLEAQSYIASLFNISTKSDEALNFEKVLKSNGIIDVNVDVEEELVLNLSKELDDISILDELKDLSSKLLSSDTEDTKENNPNQEFQIKDITENSKAQNKVSIDTAIKTEKEVKDKSKPLNLESLNELNEEEDTQKTQFQKIENTDISKNGEDSAENKDNSKEANVEAEDLDIIKLDADTKDKLFIIDKKVEIDLVKELDALTNKPEQIDTKKTIQQIAERMKFSINNNKNQIKINLKPETLGELTMEIEVVKGLLTAKVMVDNQKAKEIIQNNLFQLKDEIKDTGLEIKSFEVFVGNGNDFSKHGRGEFNFNKFNKKNQNNNLKIKKVSKENENLAYNDPSIDSINNSSNLYLKESLNLLA